MAHHSPFPMPPLQPKSKFLTVPLVILNGIFRQFVHPCASTDRSFDLVGPGDIENRQSLCAATLVCRRWFAPAKAALYCQVSPCPAEDPIAHRRYVRALTSSQALARPDVTKSIQSLSLAPFKNASLLGGIVPLLNTLYEHFRSLTRLELPPAQITLLQPRGLSTVRFMHMKTLILGASPAGDTQGANVPALADLLTILEHFPRLQNLCLASEVPLPSYEGNALGDLSLTQTLRHLRIHARADYPHRLLRQLARLPALKTLEVSNASLQMFEISDLSWAETCIMPNLDKLEIHTRLPCVTHHLGSIGRFAKLRKLRLALAMYVGESLIQDLRSFSETIEELSISFIGPPDLTSVVALFDAVPVWLPQLKWFGMDADCLPRMAGRGVRRARRDVLRSLIHLGDVLDLRGVQRDLACIAPLEQQLGDV